MAQVALLIQHRQHLRGQAWTLSNRQFCKQPAVLIAVSQIAAEADWLT
jgi:hypothetical protein